MGALGKMISAGPSWLSRFVDVKDSGSPAGPVNFSQFSDPVAITSQPTRKPRHDVLRRVPVNRLKAVETSRFFREKLGIFKALNENTARYVLGHGLAPTSLCEDTEWARIADADFAEWSQGKRFSYREDLTFAQSQKVVLPDVITDGDAGAAPVLSSRGAPAIQFFPSDSIASAAGVSLFESPGTKWEDGILRRDGGPALAYRVVKGHTYRSPVLTPGRIGGYFDYAADRFFHVGRTDRINANRPLPWLYHGEDAGLNIIDVKALELAARKLNSYFTAAITTAGGDIPASMKETLDAEIKTIQGSGMDTKQVEQRFIDLLGSAAVVPLKEGEKMEFFQNSRDSMGVTQFLDYLIAEIAVGFGVPVQFVWALTGMTGPYTRLVLQQADWFFADIADMLICDYCQPVWVSYIGHRIATGAIPAPRAGTNWRPVQWQGPGSLTIDKGRDGRLFIEMIKAGLLTREDWHEMTGKNGEKSTRRAVESIRRIMDICDELQVPYEFVLGKEFAGGAHGVAVDSASMEEMVQRIRDAGDPGADADAA